MTSSAPSSLSRYRPAILVLTGAAAAYATYLLYTSVQTAPAEGLHRSNAIRRPQRPRPRTSTTTRIVQRLQHDAHPLGEFDFFGHSIILDARSLISPAALREIAHRAEPTATPEIVESRIGQLYDAFLDRLLALTFPDRTLSTTETSAVTRWIRDRLPDEVALTRALQRHASRFAHEETEAALAADGADSIAPTDLSWRSDEGTEGEGIDSDGQTLQRTLYHIAEDRARQEGVIHRGITCNGCDNRPIRGIRWRCANCPDFDLCSDCEATNSHIKTHIFYKIRIPAPYLGLPKQEPVYPGRPHAMDPSISSALKKRLVSETKMEAEEIEALWDQFTCLAATEWEADPNSIGWAIDRRAFNHAFIPRYSSFISAPNLIYDRVFAYFDTNHDGLIGFEEFIRGLDGIHSTDMRVKLRIVFNGYDVDGDGYISRKDVLRIFRAQYAIEKEATRNYLTESAEELSVRGALETIHSSQPLGSAFTQNSIPPGNGMNERLRGKSEDDEQEPIIDDVPDTMEREEMIRRAHSEAFYEVGHSRTADESVRDRWARRQFYTDEEEGLERPEGAEDGPSPMEMEDHLHAADVDVPPTPEHERPRGSRSSSRVRFQDDVDIETRSNASTSSRPIGERWGGYEIPEPEKDLGKEVLYQFTQQAFNELLNPLFREKEDNAMDAYATRAERRTFATQIDETLEEFKREKDINRSVIVLGTFRYATWLVGSFCSGDVKQVLRQMSSSQLSREDVQERVKALFAVAEEGIVKFAKSCDANWDDNCGPEELQLWNAKLYRMQVLHELTRAICSLGGQLGWLPSSGPATPETHAEAPLGPASIESHQPTFHRDPTMPQFRPNSHADLEAQQRETTPASDADSNHASSDEAEDFISDFRYFGPIFVVAAQHVCDSKSEDSDRPAHDASTAAQAASQLENHVHPTEPAQPPPLPVSPPFLSASPVTNNPTMHLLYIDTETLTLHIEARAVDQYPYSFGPETAPVKALEYMIRREGMHSRSPLHLPFLASLETVEVEIHERKGSGLLNFEEFEAVASEGRLRFLESWMDWVPF